MSKVKTTNDGAFEQDVLKNNKPVLVDFWADWCPPCHAIAPILDELSEEYGDKLDITKLNVDENQLTPMTFQITAIPTLIIFQGGEAKQVIRGLLPKNQLKAELDKFVD